jgi:class 3 adenylate cyclase
LALVYDLAGFSTFANRPDAAQWLPRYINHVSQAIEVVVHGGVAYWIDEDEEYDALQEPSHQKFLGDGALNIWTGTNREPLSSAFVASLCDRLRDLRQNFKAVVRAASEKVQITDVPKEIRFGLALGDVHELRRTDARQREYVGICINLASRLQKYCPGIGFVGARIQMSPSVRQRRDFVRAIAKRIDGFETEYVLLDRYEYNTLDSKIRDKYFEALP